MGRTHKIGAFTAYWFWPHVSLRGPVINCTSGSYRVFLRPFWGRQMKYEGNNTRDNQACPWAAMIRKKVCRVLICKIFHISHRVPCERKWKGIASQCAGAPCPQWFATKMSPEAVTGSWQGHQERASRKGWCDWHVDAAIIKPSPKWSGACFH